WATLTSRSRACSSVPTTWNAKSLSVRSRTPSPGGSRQFWQSPPSSTWSAERAKRSRWKARSTTVATHQPVIASLRSSKSPAVTSADRGEGAGRVDDGARRLSGARRPETGQVDVDLPGERDGEHRRSLGNGRSPRTRAGPTGLARDRGRDDAGHPAGIDQLEIGEI